MTTTNDAEKIVDRLLEHAGLSLASDDRAALIDTYPHILALLARLRIDEGRSVPPATTFSAARSDDSTAQRA